MNFSLFHYNEIFILFFIYFFFYYYTCKPLSETISPIPHLILILTPPPFYYFFTFSHSLSIHFAFLFFIHSPHLSLHQTDGVCVVETLVEAVTDGAADAADVS